MTARDGSGTPWHRRHLRRHMVWAIWLGLLASLVAPVDGRPAVAQAAPGLEVLGTLDHDWLGDLPDLGKRMVLGVDVEARRLYTVGSQDFSEGVGVAAYDLSTEVPTFLADSGRLFPATIKASPATAVLDTDANRAMFLSQKADNPSGFRFVFHMDLESLAITDEWDLNASVPGLVPLGIAYSRERDRVYVVGVVEGNVNMTSALRQVAGTDGPSAVVVALDGQTGSMVWATNPGGCDAPLEHGLSGTLLGLSRSERRLYLFCSAGATVHVPTGQSGLLRMDISDDEHAVGAVQFPTELFPVSGEYRGNNQGGGAAGFDPDRERFFVHSLSDRTHGAWVFDGQRSTWIGFIAAPDNHNKFVAVDPATGKHYMIGAGGNHEGIGYVNISDASATPVPQGRLFDQLRLPSGPANNLIPTSDGVVDPVTGRLFLGVVFDTGKLDANGNPAYHNAWAVLRDTTPPVTPRPPLELDGLTHDLADDKARLEFSANTSGFGAQYVMVGGWETLYTRPRIPIFHGMLFDLARQFYPGVDNPAEIRFGNRGATVALVDGIGIASSGSSASAIATAPDENTPADAENKTRDVTDPVGSLGLGADEGESDEEAVDTGFATCLDGIGVPVTTEQGAEEAPAHAVVRCDLENLETTGFARFSGGTGGGGFVVGASSFDGRTFREPGTGVVTETVAASEGILFGDPAIGGVFIDRVTSTATTTANGLTGSAHVRWERRVEGARTFDPTGNSSEPQSCTTVVESGKDVVEEGQCEDLATELNLLFPDRFEVKFPMPEVVATPGGAFASVQQNETDFLSGRTTNSDHRRAVPGMELTVFADGVQKGRLWVQLAAVRSDATFIRSPIQQFGGFEPPVFDDEFEFDDLDTGPLASGPLGGGSPHVQAPDVADDPERAVLASHEERLVGAFGWLPRLRSLGQGLLTGVLYLLFVLPIAEVVRRRRLLDVVTDSGPRAA